jgi:uncharacterized protein (TIGR03382 family)
MNTATHSGRSPDVFGWLRRAEDWLNERGNGAWIASFVLGFIFFWPVGLVILFYWLFFRRRQAPAETVARENTHNAAFETYKAETLERLEDEQVRFEAFLDRLRAARDKQEFDAFLDERAEAARAARVAESEDDEPES